MRAGAAVLVLLPPQAASASMAPAIKTIRFMTSPYLSASQAPELVLIVRRRTGGGGARKVRTCRWSPIGGSNPD